MQYHCEYHGSIVPSKLAAATGESRNYPENEGNHSQHASNDSRNGNSFGSVSNRSTACCFGYILCMQRLLDGAAELYTGLCLGIEGRICTYTGLVGDGTVRLLYGRYQTFKLYVRRKYVNSHVQVKGQTKRTLTYRTWRHLSSQFLQTGHCHSREEKCCQRKEAEESHLDLLSGAVKSKMKEKMNDCIRVGPTQRDRDATKEMCTEYNVYLQSGLDMEMRCINPDAPKPF